MAEQQEKCRRAISYNAAALACKGNYAMLKRYADNHGNDWTTILTTLAKKRATGNADTAWKSLETLGVTLILQSHEQFPATLREMPWPPFGIYLRGDTAALRGICISIVGTRKATNTGKRIARKFAAALAETETTIISGLALGIDAAAHAGALEAGGTTVGVLACGIDTVYPREHERLAERILAANGAIISEYPIGSPALPHRFIERNRIVSGLARGVLIIEAPERSGALATARFALEQNRDVWVVPGPVDHPNYHGSHELIRAGAELVTSPIHILENLGIKQLGKPRQTTRKGNGIDTEQNPVMLLLNTAGHSLSLDEIAESLNLPIHKASETLTHLLIKGMVCEEQGRYTIA